MVRTVVIPQKNQVSIDVPTEYIGTEVEVIAFQKNEGVLKEAETSKNVSFAAIALDTAGFKFDRGEANER